MSQLFGQELTQVGGHRGVGLDGVDLGARGKKGARQRPQAGSHFDDDLAGLDLSELQ